LDTSDFPEDVVVVRHGESRGNTPVDLDHKAYHDPRTELTQLGKEQAKAAGKWIRDNIGEEFDLCFTSNFVRAMETASLLGLKKPSWLTDGRLIERTWGDLEKGSRAERREAFIAAIRARSLDVYLWTPNNGESMQAILNRLWPLYDEIKRKAQAVVPNGRTRKRVIISTHGGIIWATRVLFEHMPPELYREINILPGPEDKIHNGQVFHYSRVNPGKPDDIAPDLRWMHYTCPLQGILSDWEEIPARQGLTVRGLRKAITDAKKNGNSNGDGDAGGK